MKLKMSHILLVFAFFLSAVTYAQVDRSIGRGQYKRPKKEQKNVDFIQQSADYLTKELKLDTFQAAAVKEIMEEERGAIMSLGQEDMTTDERRDKTKEISDRIYKKTMRILSKEQAEVYTKMEESKKF